MNFAASSPNFMCGIGCGNLDALIVDLRLHLGFDFFGLPQVGCSGGELMADSVAVDVSPPDVPPFQARSLVSFLLVFGPASDLFVYRALTLRRVASQKVKSTCLPRLTVKVAITPCVNNRRPQAKPGRRPARKSALI